LGVFAGDKFMAVRGYSFNPSHRRSKVVSEIVSDMALEGLPLSEDTVRRYLSEARERLAEGKEKYLTDNPRHESSDNHANVVTHLEDHLKLNQRYVEQHQRQRSSQLCSQR